MTISLRARGVEVVLLDIEGTTTRIQFVHDVLFPYARSHLRAHVTEHLDTEDFAVVERLLASERLADQDGAAIPSWDSASNALRVDSVVAYAEWLMDRDRKSTALKMLQGQIWEGGYRSGSLTGEVFGDVPTAMERWHAVGIEVAIFSSGSVRAQQLLFGSTAYGDLTPRIRSFFDTMVGSKTESESYRRISTALKRPPSVVAFFSDSLRELRAAASAGMVPVVSIRPGNEPILDEHRFDSVRTLDDVLA